MERASLWDKMPSDGRWNSPPTCSSSSCHKAEAATQPCLAEPLVNQHSGRIFWAGMGKSRIRGSLPHTFMCYCPPGWERDIHYRVGTRDSLWPGVLLGLHPESHFPPLSIIFLKASVTDSDLGWSHGAGGWTPLPNLYLVSETVILYK